MIYNKNFKTLNLGGKANQSREQWYNRNLKK